VAEWPIASVSKTDLPQGNGGSNPSSSDLFFSVCMQLIWIDALGHLTYILQCLSFAMRDILWLRTLAIASSLASVLYMFAQPEPFELIIFWNLVFIVINIFQIANIIYNKRQLPLSPEEQFIYNKVFFSTSQRIFKRLISIGEEFSYPKDTAIINEGDAVKYLYLIAFGKVEILIEDNVIARCHRGDFLGEMSFITDGPATATVRVTENVGGYKWRQAEFKEYLKNNPSIKNELNQILGTRLVSKFNKQIPSL
jgi:hypothetical protein